MGRATSRMRKRPCAVSLAALGQRARRAQPPAAPRPGCSARRSEGAGKQLDDHCARRAAPSVSIDARAGVSVARRAPPSAGPLPATPSTMQWWTLEMSAQPASHPPARSRRPPTSPTAACRDRAAGTSRGPTACAAACSPPGAGERRSAQVVVEVEVRIVDPHRSADAERARSAPPAGSAERGAASQTSISRSCSCGRRWPLEQRDRADVHVADRVLDLEEGRVEWAQSLHLQAPIRAARGRRAGQPSERCSSRDGPRRAARSHRSAHALEHHVEISDGVTVCDDAEERVAVVADDRYPDRVRGGERHERVDLAERRAERVQRLLRPGHVRDRHVEQPRGVQGLRDRRMDRRAVQVLPARSRHSSLPPAPPPTSAPPCERPFRSSARPCWARRPAGR